MSTGDVTRCDTSVLPVSPPAPPKTAPAPTFSPRCHLRALIVTFSYQRRWRERGFAPSGSSGPTRESRICGFFCLLSSLFFFFRGATCASPRFAKDGTPRNTNIRLCRARVRDVAVTGLSCACWESGGWLGFGGGFESRAYCDAPSHLPHMRG